MWPVDHGHLYVLGELEEPAGPVKIGLHYGKPSTIGRSGLSSGNWRRLQVLHHHQVPADTLRWTEYIIHQHLRPFRKRGEWFDVRQLAGHPADWQRFLDDAFAQRIPGGERVVFGTPTHRLKVIRLIRWSPPKELVAECSCGCRLTATGTTLPALLREFEKAHANRA